MPISVAKEEKKVDYPLTQVSGTPLHQKLHNYECSRYVWLSVANQ